MDKGKINCWVNFQEKVQDLFNCVYNLPDTLHDSAIKVIEDHLRNLHTNLAQKNNAAEDSKLFLQEVVYSTLSDANIVEFSTTVDNGVCETNLAQEVDSTRGEMIVADRVKIENATVVKRKRGRRPKKSYTTSSEVADERETNVVKYEVVEVVEEIPQGEPILSVSGFEDTKVNQGHTEVAQGHVEVNQGHSDVKNLISSNNLAAFAVNSTSGPSNVKEEPTASVSLDTKDAGEENLTDENKPGKQCPHCDKVYSSMAGYKYHIKKHKEAEFRCHMDCKFVAINQKQLNQHLRKAHKLTSKEVATKSYTCPFCLKNFRTPSQLKFHKRIHTKGPLKCPHCPKEFMSKQGFEQHVNQHTGQNLHYCPKCKFSCSSESIVKSHIRVVHEQERKFLCEECGKSFASSYILRKHIEGTHCLSEVQDRYSCPQCTHKTHCAQSLKAHIRNVHSPPASYTCNICGVSLKYKHSLKLHQLRHYSDKSYKCDKCDFSANCEKNIKEHHRRVHTAAKHTCDVCDKTFSDRSHLARHRVVHTGEKQHQCRLCNYRCNVKHNLRKHMLNVHKLDEKVRNPIVKIDQVHEQQQQQPMYDDATPSQETPQDSISVNGLLDQHNIDPDQGDPSTDLLDQEIYVEQNVNTQETVYTILNYDAM